MKRWLLLSLLLLLTSNCSLVSPCTEEAGCSRILFIGNSYTFVNDLPGTLTKLAKAGRHRLETGMAAQGGWMLFDHVNSAETLELIHSRKWNFVVLQEQSQVPASEQVRTAQMIPAVRARHPYFSSPGPIVMAGPKMVCPVTIACSSKSITVTSRLARSSTCGWRPWDLPG